MSNVGNRTIILEKEKVNSKGYYKVGYDKENNQYVLANVVCWIAWYYRYYAITEEEYKWFETDIDKLTSLANDCEREKTSSKRFICSEAERDYVPFTFLKEINNCNNCD
jgi:hypothetical protein